MANKELNRYSPRTVECDSCHKKMKHVQNGQYYCKRCDIEFEDDLVASTEDQHVAITRYCETKGWKIEKRYIDRHVSGLTPLADRPSGGKLYAGLKRGDRIIVQRLDRLTRDTVTGLKMFDDLDKLGVEVHLADEGGCSIDCTTPTGRLIATALLMALRFQVDNGKKVTSDSMKSHIKQGKRQSGHAPYGWQHNPGGNLERNATEQANVTRIMDLTVRYGPAVITRQMNAAGSRNRSGNRWRTRDIKRIQEYNS